MFRRAVATDVEGVVGLMASYYGEEGYPFDVSTARAAIGGLVADPALGGVWVADADGGPAAYVALTLGYSLEYGGRDAFIDDLYVAPAHRGGGLGRAGVEVAVAACQALGVRALHLEVERHKEGARALYRRRGFADHDRVLMTKPLPADAPGT